LKAHLEVLGRGQRGVLRRLGPLAEARGFYLAGGTALALQLGHRRSVDFDWFTSHPLADPMGLARQIQADAGIALEVDATERGTLHGRLSGVRVSFLEYRYPLLAELIRPLSVATPLASLADIGCMKLSALAQRGARKDFVDVYALGLRMPLAELLRCYRKKFGVSDIGHVLTALTYFEDADLERPPHMLRRAPWPAVKAALRRWVKEIAG
jgi:hypothetical protein